MPTAPKVSVIMSVWNNGPYVAKTIDSILAQTFDNFEFIIMDDRGGDNTVEIIRSYNDPRIKLHTNPENMGIARSLNSAISKATGEYIAVMDGDDIAEPERLAQQVEAVNNGWPFTLSQWHENIVIAHVRWEKANAPIMFQVIGKHPVYKDLRSMNDEVLEHEIRQFLEPG